MTRRYDFIPRYWQIILHELFFLIRRVWRKILFSGFCESSYWNHILKSDFRAFIKIKIFTSIDRAIHINIRHGRSMINKVEMWKRPKYPWPNLSMSSERHIFKCWLSWEAHVSYLRTFLYWMGEILYSVHIY